jgi:Tfp pilus assembly protein PilO
VTKTPANLSARWKHWPIHTAGVAACLAITAVAYFAGVHDPLQRFLGTAVQRVELDHRRQTELRLIGQMQELERRTAQVRRELEAEPVLLRPTGHLNQVLAQLASLAGERGLVIKSVHPGSIQSGPSYEAVPISLVTVGTYRTCAQFMRDLRRRCPDVTLTSFSLTGNPAPTASAAELQAQMVWYAAPVAASAR